MVFYRKYRPQTISELDSEEIRQKLFSVFSDFSTTPHAFLFTGPKGLGKTSAARIVAKVVNCEKKRWEVGNEKLEKEVGSGKKKKSNLSLQNPHSYIQPPTSDIEPCNNCSQCISITNGTNMDILEIDGASNRGIDEIRDLREKIKLAPFSANKKVYIIDEVHMLTTEAFNALLKTLEEPPAHIIFILCTTEPHKVPATISSRCTHIQFKLATTHELLRSFKRISKDEKLDIEEEALSYIAEMSDGSFRDGVKVLDELASMSRSSNILKITKEVLEEKFQISNFKFQISKMIEHLEKKDTKGALKLISELVEQGIDMKYFIEKLVEELHSLLLFQIGIGGPVRDFLPASAPAKPRSSDAVRAVGSPFISVTPKLSIQELKNLIELFTKAYGELKYAVLPSIPLEIAVIEWGVQAQRDEENRGITQNLTQKDAESNFSVVPRIVQRGSAPNTSVKKVASKSDNNVDLWTKLIDKVKLQNQSIAGILRGCSLKSWDDKDFVIEAKYKFHKDKLSENKSMEIIEKVIVEIIGKPVKVGVVLKEK